MRPRELLFVYNARAGVLHALVDTAHKLVSPATYPCKLCALTYGNVRMRPRWRTFVDELPHRVRFVYADELAREIPPGLAELPALVEVRGGRLDILLAKQDIEGCRSLDDLMTRVREVVT